MKTIWAFFTMIFTLCTATLAADFEYEPNLLSGTAGAWHQGDEYYSDIYYNKELVFHVLNKYIHLFNDYKIEAARRGVNLKCRKFTKGNGFFHSPEVIHKHFYFDETKCQIITIYPSDLILVKSGLFCIDYYVRITNSGGNDYYVIDEQTYKNFQALKISATNSKKNISLDLNILIVNPERASNEFNKSFKVVDRAITASQNCVVCTEDRCDVLFQPCYHLCSCEKCAKKLSSCPMCQAVIHEKNKVFFP